MRCARCAASSLRSASSSVTSVTVSDPDVATTFGFFDRFAASRAGATSLRAPRPHATFLLRRTTRRHMEATVRRRMTRRPASRADRSSARRYAAPSRAAPGDTRSPTLPASPRARRAPIVSRPRGRIEPEDVPLRAAAAARARRVLRLPGSGIGIRDRDPRCGQTHRIPSLGVPDLDITRTVICTRPRTARRLRRNVCCRDWRMKVSSMRSCTPVPNRAGRMAGRRRASDWTTRSYLRSAPSVGLGGRASSPTTAATRPTVTARRRSPLMPRRVMRPSGGEVSAYTHSVTHALL